MFNRLHAVRLCAAVLVTGLWASSASAEPPSPVTLAQVLERTLSRHPDLTAWPHALRAADADRLIASQRPRPEFSVEVENLSTRRPADTLDEVEVTLALSQIFELGGQRDQRHEVARQALLQQQQAYAQVRLDVLGEAVRRYLDLITSHARIDITEQALALARQAEAIGQRRVQVGVASDADLTRLRLTRRQAELDCLRARIAQQAASQQLAALWGEADRTNLEPTSTLRPLPPLPSLQQIRDRLDQAPALLAQASEVRLRAAELRLAETWGHGSVTVSGGLRHARASDDTSVLLGLSVPLGTGAANRPRQMRAEATLAASEANLQARRIEVQARIEALYRELSLIREELTLIESDALPLARQLYTELERGYSSGRHDLLELNTARQEQITLQQRALDLAARFHQQRNELERLTGLSFAAPIEQDDAP